MYITNVCIFNLTTPVKHRKTYTLTVILTLLRLKRLHIIYLNNLQDVMNYSLIIKRLTRQVLFYKRKARVQRNNQASCDRRRPWHGHVQMVSGKRMCVRLSVQRYCVGRNVTLSKWLMLMLLFTNAWQRLTIVDCFRFNTIWRTCLINLFLFLIWMFSLLKLKSPVLKIFFLTLRYFLSVFVIRRRICVLPLQNIWCCSNEIKYKFGLQIHVQKELNVNVLLFALILVDVWNNCWHHYQYKRHIRLGNNTWRQT